MRGWAAGFLMLCLVGCSSGTSREFAVGFEQAEPKLRKLYPPILAYRAGMQELLNISTSQQAHFTGPLVSVRRDELFDTPKVRIVIEEGGKMLKRSTEIVLIEDRATEGCRVTVCSSHPGLLFSERDKAFESAILDDIAAALK